MDTIRIPRLASLLLCASAALGAIGCSNETGPGPVVPDTAAVAVPVQFSAVAGGAPLVLDSSFVSDAGITYKISRLRFYATSFALLDTVGRLVPVTLVDSANVPLKYGVALVDFSQPSSLALRVSVPPGKYTGLTLTLGVPPFDDLGKQLNHSDASVRQPPLDVDTDMYWGWNPGYIFLKIEGKSLSGKEWLNFYYHIGRDKRLMPVTIAKNITVSGKSATTFGLKVNTNRAFVTADGTHRPNILGGEVDRIANDGDAADTVALNCANSGFITLAP